MRSRRLRFLVPTGTGGVQEEAVIAEFYDEPPYPTVGDVVQLPGTETPFRVVERVLVYGPQQGVRKPETLGLDVYLAFIPQPGKSAEEVAAAHPPTPPAKSPRKPKGASNASHNGAGKGP